MSTLKGEFYWLTALVRIVWLFMFLFTIIGIILSYEGFNFPNKQELEHKTGTFKTYQKNVGGGRGGAVMITAISLVSDNNKFTDFDCSYSPLGQSSNCLSKEKFDAYHNQKATIGYYYHKKFLWVHNPLPQIITLKINDKQVQSYEDTKQKIKERNQSNLPYMLFFGILATSLWFFGDYALRIAFKNT